MNISFTISAAACWSYCFWFTATNAYFLFPHRITFPKRSVSSERIKLTHFLRNNVLRSFRIHMGIYETYLESHLATVTRLPA